MFFFIIIMTQIPKMNNTKIIRRLEFFKRWLSVFELSDVKDSLSPDTTCHTPSLMTAHTFTQPWLREIQSTYEDTTGSSTAANLGWVFLFCLFFFYFKSVIHAVQLPVWVIFFSVLLNLIIMTSKCESFDWNIKCLVHHYFCKDFLYLPIFVCWAAKLKKRADTTNWIFTTFGTGWF